MEETQKVRWAIELKGSRLDKRDAVLFFGAGSDPMIRDAEDGQGNSVTLLTSPQFESLNDTTKIFEIAKLLATENGILFVLEPAREPLQARGILQQTTDGKWNKTVAGTGRSVARGRARGVGMAIVDGKQSPQHMIPPPSIRWSAEAQADQLVADVFMYLSGEPDWFSFWKAFELMRDDINARQGGQHRQQQMGWPSKKELDDFTLSVQVYRHAPPWKGGMTPDNAMPLKAAARFIQGLAATWLAWRFPAAT